MKIIRGPENICINENTIVSIGKFDGDHRGHQEIFRTMRNIKATDNFKLVAFTFIFEKSNAIFDREKKLWLLEKEGMDYVIELPFNETTRTMPAMTFLKDILIDRVRMKYLVAGEDCSFGYRKEGSREFLEKHKDEYGYQCVFISKLKTESGEEISSTLIRKLLDEGRSREASELLNTPR